MRLRFRPRRALISRDRFSTRASNNESSTRHVLPFATFPFVELRLLLSPQVARVNPVASRMEIGGTLIRTFLSRPRANPGGVKSRVSLLRFPALANTWNVKPGSARIDAFFPSFRIRDFASRRFSRFDRSSRNFSSHKNQIRKRRTHFLLSRVSKRQERALRELFPAKTLEFANER